MMKSANYLLLHLSVVLMAASGCDSVDPPAYRLNMVEAVNNDVSEDYQQEIADVLGAMFGTPDEPYAMTETGLDQSMLNMAAGPAWTDQKGANFGLYRKHCVHCHGITGDGRGPTARFLNPYPRDYRMGVYKFKSTYNPDRPTDEDLTRVLVNGVPGTAMPSFSLLPGSEVEALVEYVKYLSIRGQMERALAEYVSFELGEDEIEDENGDMVVTRIPLNPVEDAEQREAIMEILDEIVVEWQDANEKMIIPTEESIPADERSEEEVLASVEKGRELFYGKRANCYTCHGPTGLGDGQQDDYDVWNKAHHELITEVENLSKGDSFDEQYYNKKEVAESLYVPRNAIPRNLRQGIYRGGRRRIDIFHRIYAGIAGTPMPASGPAAPGASGTLSEEEIWSIVDYVLSLPYEPASQPQRELPVNLGSISE